MSFTNILLAATFYTIMNSIFMNTQGYEGLRDDNSDEDVTSADHHTFVALIDIMFTDTSRNTCTGTIIHDNVVITGAHCFYSENNKNTRAELTASFVVIGTKHLFETGYEQYLPIERVVTHPKFRDWTADLALVFTFAGMTSDKPGTVMSLAGERTSTPVDSNVTVISWGHLKDDTDNDRGINVDSKKPCSDSVSQEKAPLRARHSVEDIKPPPEIHKKDFKPFLNFNFKTTLTLNKKTENSNTKGLHNTKVRNKLLKYKDISKLQLDLNEYKQRAQQDIAPKVQSRYLTMFKEEKNPQINEQSHYNWERIRMNTKKYFNNNMKTSALRVKERMTKKLPTLNISLLNKHDEFEIYNIKSYYKNWRRQMGTEQNKLVVETFGFVNMQTCKRFLESAVPNKYELKGTNDVVCYSTEGYHITEKDSGAPAIRQGRLVAVTIGGIKYDGEHVAIGMKMNCYCSWITDNLPPGSTVGSCCKNCCDIKHGDSDMTSIKNNKYV